MWGIDVFAYEKLVSHVAGAALSRLGVGIRFGGWWAIPFWKKGRLSTLTKQLRWAWVWAYGLRISGQSCWEKRPFVNPYTAFWVG
jgi:hypothetical protein